MSEGGGCCGDDGFVEDVFLEDCSFVACSFVVSSFVGWSFVVCLYGVMLCVSKGDVLIRGIIVGWMG